MISLNLNNKAVVTVFSEYTLSNLLTVIQLKAHELGLGSCWIQTMGKVNSEGRSTEDVVKELLNVPAELKLSPRFVPFEYADK